jgi:NADH-quinone oxidoreductase subunit E
VPRLSDDNVTLARQIIARYPRSKSALIPLLHVAQEQDGWVSPEAMEHIAELLGLTPAEVLGTASFYEMFKLHPVGEYLVGVCTNISCMILGAYELLHHAESTLGVKTGGTTPDGRFTLEEMECVAACTGAPCVLVNYRYFENVTSEGFDKLIDDLRANRLRETVPSHGTTTRVRQGPNVPQTVAAAPTVPPGDVG